MSEGCMACGHGLMPKQYKEFDELQKEQGGTIPKQYCFCPNGQKLADEGRLRNLLLGVKPETEKTPSHSMGWSTMGYGNTPSQKEFQEHLKKSIP